MQLTNLLTSLIAGNDLREPTINGNQLDAAFASKLYIWNGFEHEGELIGRLRTVKCETLLPI